MNPAASSPIPHAVTGLTEQEERIRHLPAIARAAFHQFQVDGDPAILGTVLFAILEDFSPRTLDQPLAEMPGSTRLMEDLGFDSLAITEVVFYVEDLFGVTITNREIIQVRSLDDLRGFIGRKVDIRQTR